MPRARRGRRLTVGLVAGRAGALDIGAWPSHPRLGFTWQPGEHSFPRLTRGWASPRDLAPGEAEPWKREAQAGRAAPTLPGWFWGRACPRHPAQRMRRPAPALAWGKDQGNRVRPSRQPGITAGHVGFAKAS